MSGSSKNSQHSVQDEINLWLKKVKDLMRYLLGPDWLLLSVAGLAIVGALAVVSVLLYRGSFQRMLTPEERIAVGSSSEWVEKVKVVMEPADTAGMIHVKETIEVEVRGEQIKSGFVRTLPKVVASGDGVTRYGISVESVSRFSGTCKSAAGRSGETYESTSEYRKETDKSISLTLGHKSGSKKLPRGRNCFVLAYTLTGSFWDGSKGLHLRWPVNFPAGIPTKNAVLALRFPKAHRDTHHRSEP